MKKLTNWPLLFVLGLMLTGVAQPLAVAQKFYSETGYVEFLSRAPALTFRGTSKNLTGLIDISERKLDFYLDLNTLDTGIRLRNRHMRDSYLETRKYPFAEFVGLFEGDSLSDGAISEVVAQGKFTIHGVTREISVTGTLHLNGDKLHLRAEFEVELSDYNIDRPAVVFYELSETQVVSLDITLTKYDD